MLLHVDYDTNIKRYNKFKSDRQPPIGQETSMKNVTETALTEDAPPFQLKDLRAIDDIDGGFQEINDKENTFRDNDKETLVEKKIEKVRKKESVKDVRERRENEKAARQHEYLKLKRIELQLKAKKYKAKYNIDTDNDVDEM